MPLGGMNEGDAVRDQYRHLVPELAKLNLAFLDIFHVGDDELLREFRTIWPTALLVVRVGRSREKLAHDVENGLADIVPLGRWALANPDAAERIFNDAPLNEPDPGTFYGGDETGYTDYPELASA